MANNLTGVSRLRDETQAGCTANKALFHQTSGANRKQTTIRMAPDLFMLIFVKTALMHANIDDSSPLSPS